MTENVDAMLAATHSSWIEIFSFVLVLNLFRYRMGRVGRRRVGGRVVSPTLESAFPPPPL